MLKDSHKRNRGKKAKDVLDIDDLKMKRVPLRPPYDKQAQNGQPEKNKHLF